MADPFKVDFFIVGFPKCGTTALYSCLAQHPNICFSTIKEPFYFSTDFPNRQVITSSSQYQNLFKHHKSGQLRGEATACYIYSDSAPERIANLYPAAKIIILIRQPVEMIQSLHANQVRVFDEPLKKLEDAWDAQSKRAAGELIPANCREPAFLQYANMGRQAHHIQRFQNYFSADQQKIFFFDDWKENSQLLFDQVCHFLGIPTQAIPAPEKNSALSYMNKRHENVGRIIRFITQNPTLLRLKNKFGIMNLQSEKWIRKHLMQPSLPPTLSPECNDEILATLEADIQQLETLTGRSLTHWRHT